MRGINEKTASDFEMTMDMPARSEGSEDIRAQAEKKLPFETIPIHRMSEADVAALVHEVRVHQIELEMQNEQLRAAQVELETSRSQYADLFDFAPVAYFVFDEMGCIREVNLTGASMLRRERRDLAGKPFNLFVHPRDREHFRRHREEIFASGRSEPCEIRLLCPDESVVVVQICSEGRTTPGDETLVLTCRTAMTDITALTESQVSLKASERRFRTLAENSPDIIVRMDHDLRISYINDRVEELTGISVDRILGRPPVELDLSDNACSSWSRASRRVFETGQAQQVEFDYPLDGTTRYFSVSFVPEYDGEGRAVTALSVVRDVTQRHRMEQALHDREEQLRLAVEGGDLATWDRDLLTERTTWSERMYTLLGRDPDGPAITGETFFDYIHDDDLPRVLRHLAETLTSEREFNDEFRVLREDGQVLWLAAAGCVYRDENGTAVRMSGINYDITERKRAEEALRNVNASLEQRVQERTVELERAVSTLREEMFERIEVQRMLEHRSETLQKIVNSIPVVLWFYDADGNVRLVNEELHRVLGYALEDFQDNAVMAMCYPDPEYRRKVWGDMMSADGQWRDRYVQSKRGGRVLSSWADIGLSNGSYIGIGIDIRQRRRFENRIKESEERYRTLVELSPDGIGIERDGTIRFLNRTACRMLGAEQVEDLMGRPVLDFIHPDDRARATRLVEYLRRRRRPLPVVEAKVVRLDGTAMDVELSGTPITFRNRPANQIVMRDTTERKVAERRLRDSAIQLQRQAELLDLAHDTIVVTDMEGQIIFWNHGAEASYGWTSDETTGRISHELLNTRFPREPTEIGADFVEHGQWHGELTHTTRSGQTRIVSSRWALQRDDHGHPVAILEIDRDITDRKANEQALAEARRFAESVIETVREALVVLDPALKVLSANRAFYETFQVVLEETEGRAIYEIGNGQWNIPELRRLLEEILPRNRSFEEFEVEHDFERIGRCIMRLNARRIRRDDQKTQMILLAIRDITIRKQQERAIIENQQKLAQLTEELLLTEERERRRIATALHDSIGQSLAFSKRELGRLAKDVPENLAMPLNRAREQIDEAIQQTRSLTFELSPSTLYTFGLEAAIEELAEQFMIREGLQCHLEVHGEEQPMAEQTRVLLYRATRELLINVVKHAVASNVALRVMHRSRTVRIEIEDDGNGFDTEILAPMRGKEETFGLFSIRERLAHIDGSFVVKSVPGQGTKVTMEAPLEPSGKDGTKE